MLDASSIRAAEIDKSNEFPMELWKKLGDLGVLGVEGGRVVER